MSEWTLRAATPEDWGPVVALLEGAGLPMAGVPRDLARFTVAEDAGSGVVGAIGLEVYDRSALLRSAVVAPGWQSVGIGGRLVAAVVAEAASLGVEELFLLTTTAADYFPRFGFVRTDRSKVPVSLQASEELRGACPATAIVMRREVRHET